MTTPRSFGPRLLAGVGLLALLGGIGLMSSRPARTAGGPIPVTVSNLPLPTLPTDVAAPRQPVGTQVLVTVTGGFGSDTVYTVPAGKRLVIETISATTEFPNTAPNSYSVLVVINNFAAFSAFPLLPSGSFASGSQSVHLYADPGTTVLGRVFGKSTASDQIGVSLSGYLVDAPAAAAQLQAAQVQAAPKDPALQGLATQE